MRQPAGSWLQGAWSALVAGLVLSAAGCGGARAAAGDTDAAGSPTTYWALVANESSDLISQVAFTPGIGARVGGEVPVGILPADIDGPHGLVVGPGGREWYVSIAHGQPFGKVWKFAGADSLVAEVELGMFPASMAVTPDGRFLFVSNFNLHGDTEPSSVSVVYTPTMTEVARPTTCVMPHGGRLNASGTKHYSVCMHSDQLVEIDAKTFEVTGRMSLTPGSEQAVADESVDTHVSHGFGTASCSPTWAVAGAGARADTHVYVACNRNEEILELDVRSWSVTRRFETGRGPYNLAVTPDGRLLLATLKADQAVAIIDLESGRELRRIETTQPVTHGVAITRDARYAFISNEAIGATPGTVDVIDLDALERVSSVAVRYQPGGIDVWQ
ncbi:MAG: YncE family protein [Longimicrobiales bacterium]